MPTTAIKLLEDRDYFSPTLYKLHSGSNAILFAKPSVVMYAEQKVFTSSTLLH